MAKKKEEEKPPLESAENQRIINYILEACDTAYNKRVETGFEINLDTWKENYEGESAETRERESAGRAAIYPHHATTSVDQPVYRFVTTLFSREPYFEFGAGKPDKETINAAEIANDILFNQMQRGRFCEQVTKYLMEIFTYGLGCARTGWDFLRNDISVKKWPIKHFFCRWNLDDTTDLPWGVFESWQLIDELEEINAAWAKKHKKQILYEKLDIIKERGGPEEMTEEDSTSYTPDEISRLVHVLEWYDRKRYVVLANRELVMLDSENPVGFVPAVLATAMPKLEGLAGRGEIEAIDPIVRQIATIINQRFDNVDMTMQPIWLQNVGVTIVNEDDLSNLRAGLRIKIDDLDVTVDPRNALRPFDIPNITQGSYQDVAYLENSLKDINGLQDPQMGQMPPSRTPASSMSQVLSAGSLPMRFKLTYSLKTAFSILPQQMLAWNQKYMSEDYIYLMRGTKEGAKDFLDLGKAQDRIRRASRKDIQGDLVFLERLQALEAQFDKAVRRGQFIEAYRIILQGNQFLQFSPDQLREILRYIIKTFDIPELEAVMGERAAPTSPEELFGRLTGDTKGVRGAHPTTAVGAMSGRQEGGQRGAVAALVGL